MNLYIYIYIYNIVASLYVGGISDRSAPIRSGTRILNEHVSYA